MIPYAPPQNDYISQQPAGVQEYLELVEKSHHLISMALEWIAEGWGLSEPPSLEQVVAALFMEAATQDECVKNGESDASWPKFLRASAYQILYLIGHKQEVSVGGKRSKSPRNVPKDQK